MNSSLVRYNQLCLQGSICTLLCTSYVLLKNELFCPEPSTLPHMIFFSELACTETAQRADSISSGLPENFKYTYSALILWQDLKTKCWVQMPCAKQTYGEKIVLSLWEYHIASGPHLSVCALVSGAFCVWDEQRYLTRSLYSTQETVAGHAPQDVHSS